MRDVVLRHALMQRCEEGAEDVERCVAGHAHEFELVGRLSSAASYRYRIGGDEFASWSRLSQVIVKGEAPGLFYSDAAGPDAAIGERGGSELGRTLILLPSANLKRELEPF